MGQNPWVTLIKTIEVGTFGQIRLREALSPVSQSVFIIICRRGPCKKDYHPTSSLSWIVIWNDNIIVRMYHHEVAWSQSLKQPDELLKGGDVFQVWAGGNKIHISLSLAHKHATAFLGALWGSTLGMKKDLAVLSWVSDCWDITGCHDLSNHMANSQGIHAALLVDQRCPVAVKQSWVGAVTLYWDQVPLCPSVLAHCSSLFQYLWYPFHLCSKSGEVARADWESSTSLFFFR